MLTLTAQKKLNWNSMKKKNMILCKLEKMKGNKELRKFNNARKSLVNSLCFKTRLQSQSLTRLLTGNSSTKTTTQLTGNMKKSLRSVSLTSTK